MRSYEILSYLPPINLEKALAYLNNLPFSDLYYEVKSFSKLSEDGMANYSFPKEVSEIKERILNSRYGKDSGNYKDFYTTTTAISILRACARINIAIYALHNRCVAQEAKIPRYLKDSYENYSSCLSLHDTNDKEIMNIKDAATKAKEWINYYSKKYTIDGFEENFINTLKYNVYSICERFNVETRTLTQRATDAGEDFLIKVVLFLLFVGVFFLMAKCACG